MYPNASRQPHKDSLKTPKTRSQSPWAFVKTESAVAALINKSKKLDHHVPWRFHGLAIVQ
jgi:hypothetical protein